MKIYRTFLLMIATGLITLMAIPALAHADLLRSDPAAGAVLDHAPSEIFAWFSQPLSTGSRLSVFDAQFQPVDKGQTFIDASDATLMRTQVQHLQPGRYTVTWKANSVDGHESNGSYDFIVQDSPNYTPAIIGAVALVIMLIVVIVALLVN